MPKTILDDGYHEYLTDGAAFVGNPGIPMLMDLQNTQIPKGMIPFKNARTCKDRRQYVHFYMHDREFSCVLTATKRYIGLLKQFDGVITPDCTMLINQSPCLQQTNTYFNRAIGYFLQRNGIPVIPNIRWSDESSFEYCFLGVPQRTMVCVSTHGCIHSKAQRQMFKRGLEALLKEIEPLVILVHGYMPDDVFAEYMSKAKFVRYPSQFELMHPKEGA